MKEVITKWNGRSIEAPGRVPSAITCGVSSASIVNTDSVYSIGMVKGYTGKIETGFLYTFLTNIKTEAERGKAYAVLTQIDADGNEISGDYFSLNADGSASISIEPMKECNSFAVEFTLYSFGEGKAEFSYPEIIREEKKTHREINVATAYFPRKWCKDCMENVKTVLSIMDKAAKDENKPDIICFTETTYDRGIDLPLKEKYISDNNEAVSLVCEKAKEHGMYVIFSFHENENGAFYNTAAVISPEGKIIEKVRKTHLCYDELTGGMVPGKELKVIELPFGKIAVLICWDQWFPEAARKLADNGAEIIFVPTGGFPECISRARAYENGIFIVTSGCADGQPESSFVANEHGDIIGRVESEEKGYVSVPIDLDEHKYIRYLSFNNGYGRNLYAIDRRNDLYKEENV